jgi:hypothetical protein
MVGHIEKHHEGFLVQNTHGRRFMVDNIHQDFIVAGQFKDMVAEEKPREDEPIEPR